MQRQQLPLLTPRLATQHRAECQQQGQMQQAAQGHA
jgi:hypothetical protein